MERRCLPKDAPGGVHRIFSYIERGFYAAQIRVLLSMFPRNQILFLQVDDLWSEPAQTLARIERFLGVPEIVSRGPERGYIEAVPGASGDGRILSAIMQNRLQKLFAPDICETARLTGLDLGNWLAENYEEDIRPSPAPEADR